MIYTGIAFFIFYGTWIKKRLKSEYWPAAMKWTENVKSGFVGHSERAAALYEDVYVINTFLND